MKFVNIVEVFPIIIKTYIMEKIPTAEEMEMSGEYEDYTSMMIAFAKLHLQEFSKQQSINKALTEKYLELHVL